jgi:hypothetical protein
LLLALRTPRILFTSHIRVQPSLVTCLGRECCSSDTGACTWGKA